MASSHCGLRRRASVGLVPRLFGQHRAQIGLLHARVGTHLLGRVEGDDLAVDQHRDPVGQAEDDAHVVLDGQQRLAAVTSRISSTKRAVSLRLMPAVGSSSRITSAPPAIVMPISSARCSA